MKLSQFGAKFSSQSGIQVLMDDLGAALAGDSEILMLGGGNPAHIPAVERYFQERIQAIASSPLALRKLIGTYDPPQGDQAFIQALVEMLNRHYDWNLRPENVALTNGSQSAFFMLFNMFGGRDEEGGLRQILLPVTPEYIGYADAGIESRLFCANKPSIELFGDHTFKYHIDFASLQLNENIAAVCVSRPTNPSGNVITDLELEKLAARAREVDIPLIVDAAYGLPFPGLVYTAAKAHWDEGIILSLSLSKFGLPAARTGIVIAREDIVQALSRINAILNLATNSFGSMLALELAQRDELLTLAAQCIRPYYRAKAEKAQETLHQVLTGLPYHLHRVEGAMFLWLWLEGLPITSQQLYERLKEQGVLVVPGHYFFPGLDEAQKQAWPHCRECIRISYAQDDEKVRQGLMIIGREVRKLYQA